MDAFLPGYREGPADTAHTDPAEWGKRYPPLDSPILFPIMPSDYPGVKVQGNTDGQGRH